MVPELFATTEVTLASGRRVSASTALTLLRARAAEFDVETVRRLCDVDEGMLRALAGAFADRGPLCYYTYNGVEQHVDTMQTNRALCSLYALTGWLESEGGNVTFGPRRGHADLLPKGQHEKRLGFAQRPLGAASRALQSYNLYTSVLDGDPYRVRALVAFGGNMLMQSAQTLRGREALSALEFYVQVDLFETPSARFADILLPATTPWESPALSTTFVGKRPTPYVQHRQPVIEPLFETRPDIEIIFDLAGRLGLSEHFAGGNVARAFEDQLKPLGLSLADLRTHPEGRLVDKPPAFRRYAVVDEHGRVAGFQTPSKRIELYSETFVNHGYDPLPDGQRRQRISPEFPLFLTSHKLVQYLHGQGRGIPGLRRQVPGPYVEIHPDTAHDLDIATGELVRIVTDSGSIKLSVRVTTDVAPDVVATQTGWWEGCEELGLPGFDPFSTEGRT